MLLKVLVVKEHILGLRRKKVLGVLVTHDDRHL